MWAKAGRWWWYPWMSDQLMTGPYVSICGFGTLIKGTLAVRWSCSCTFPYYQNTFCLYRGLNQEPSASQLNSPPVFRSTQITPPRGQIRNRIICRWKRRFGLGLGLAAIVLTSFLLPSLVLPPYSVSEPSVCCTAEDVLHATYWCIKNSLLAHTSLQRSSLQHSILF